MLATAGDGPRAEVRDFAGMRAPGAPPPRWVWEAPGERAEPEQGSPLGRRVEPEVEKKKPQRIKETVFHGFLPPV